MQGNFSRGLTVKAYLKNREHFNSAVMMTFDTESEFDAVPGQFVNIMVPVNTFSLRRPFSLFSYSKNSFQVLIKVLGDGTEAITEMGIGQSTDVLIPLGSDSRAETDKNTLFIAGGIGIAGLHSFCLEESMMIFGDRNGEYSDIIDRFFPNAFYVTETGIRGSKGVVTDYMKDFHYGSILACGPEPMLKAIQKGNAANKKYFAVCERVMACGLGLCSGCTVKYNDNTFRKVCKDGPVLDGMRIEYD